MKANKLANGLNHKLKMFIILFYFNIAKMLRKNQNISWQKFKINRKLKKKMQIYKYNS